MLTITNLTNLEIDRTILENILSVFTDREVDLTICDNNLIKRYNREYRGVDKATDVLSFPIDGTFEVMPLGSIIISNDFVKKNAKKFGHGEEDELALLFLHGLLHLMGYDHEMDNGEMRRKEEEIIITFHLPKSLIVRVEEEI